MVSGYAVYRSGALEGTVSLQSQQPSLTFPFDNTAGYGTGLAVANAAAGSTEITATLWDDAGNSLGSQVLSVAGGGHTAFIVPFQLPTTAGKRGLIKLDAAAGGAITGISLRFSASGTFVSLPPVF